MKALHTAGDLVSHVGERVVVIKGAVIIPPSEVVCDNIPRPLLDPLQPRGELQHPAPGVQGGPQRGAVHQQVAQTLTGRDILIAEIKNG